MEYILKFVSIYTSQFTIHLFVVQNRSRLLVSFMLMVLKTPFIMYTAINGILWTWTLVGPHQFTWFSVLFRRGQRALVEEPLYLLIIQLGNRL